MKARIERRPNEALRRERLRRHWTQQELAERLGTTTATISHWEGGLRTPGPYFSHLLCELFEKSPEALGLLADDQPAASKDTSTDAPGGSLASPVATSRSLWCVPYQCNLFFTGRDSLLTTLHTTWQNGPATPSTPIQAISGLGGMGKTQTALEYAYRFRQEYQAVLWARAETAEGLTADLMSIAEVLALPEHKDPDQPRVVKAVQRWLSQHTNWLLILDNVDDLSLISYLLSFEVSGHVLLTMRAQAVGTLAQRLDLAPMPPEEGVLFLLRRAKLLPPETPLEEVDPTLYREAQEVYQFMGGLPLALDQAGAYIEATQCTLSDYRHFLQSSHLRLLAERDVHIDHPLSVSRTFTLTFERLARTHPLAAELLTVCAYLAPEAIPETFFLEGAPWLGSPLETLAADPLQLNGAIKALLAYSLLQRDANARTVTVHRLVQTVLKGYLSEAEHHTWATRLVHAMTQLFPSEETHIDYWRSCERLLAHALVCLALSEQWGEDEEQRITLMTHVAAYLSRRARYQEAEPLLQRALRMREQILGSEHPQCATVLQELAEMYRAQGKFEQTEHLCLRALHLREQALGANHLLVAQSLNKLGKLYTRQGKYAQAEPLLQRALHIAEQASESEHPLLASLLRELGVLYYQQGKYAQAEPFCQRSLQIEEQILGSEHPQLAASLNNLGFLYFLQGKYEQAEPLLLRSLQIKEQVFGSEHLELASTLHGLGILYCEQGKYEQAASSLLRVLQITEQALGSEHLLLAYPLLGLANLHREQAHYEQARSLYQRALALRQQHLGQQHPEVAETLHDFAQFFQVQQQTTEALPLYQQALAIREQTLGSHNPETEQTRSALLHLLQTMGRVEDAAALQGQAPVEEK